MNKKIKYEQVMKNLKYLLDFILNKVCSGFFTRFKVKRTKTFTAINISAVQTNFRYNPN
ncbi:hypothetical protein CHCC19466_0090 [Bacillus licheniformis]|nr:hypothetical protein MUY_000955 [Bacillus licheniformis WX-02]KYC71314.1 hypothetical protein B4092_0934 [Bacillus licheniformis]TWJ46624.1 hypothetical protein CHCC5025_0006 [Bacillus licheniformis]TWJ94660.1 hypothetical protein CHCC20495_0026 [Bacillus licheniformis]TWK15293.1 hypothetical protein CHCC20373_2104 [Bacillus licheniformis]